MTNPVHHGDIYGDVPPVGDGYLPPPWQGFDGGGCFGGAVHWSFLAGNYSQYDHYQGILYSGASSNIFDQIYEAGAWMQAQNQYDSNADFWNSITSLFYGKGHGYTITQVKGFGKNHYLGHFGPLGEASSENGRIVFENKTAAYDAILSHLFRDAANSGGSDWHPPMAVGDVGNAASFASGAIGLTQIGMLEYRMSLPIMSKIGTFGKFGSMYGTLGKFGGRLGYAGAGISLISNISEVRSGDIGLGRFSYRLGSLGASTGTGAASGGPYGAAAVAAVGGISVGAEYIYDNMLVPLGNEIQYQIWNFENAIRNGWYPGR